jgi:atypical dual specificity phosphatase
VAAIRARAALAAAVVVTHDLELARELADRVLLVVAGRIAAAGAAADFFASPPNELAARFVAQGNCWLPPPPPELPRHFHWLLPGRLAGMGRPGLTGDLDSDLAAVAAAGVTLLVALTSEPVPAARLRPFGLACRHFAIPDMGVPAVGPTARLCRDVERALGNGEAVAVHCHAGLGRTGLVLASFLVWLGMAPAAAIARVREVVPGYIQNRAQEEFVRRFAAASAPAPDRRPHPLLAAAGRS